MTYLLCLFSLKPDADRDAYERWARTTDIPTVRALPSNRGFDLLRLTAVRGSDTPPPYHYAELIRVGDMAQFGADVATDTMRRVAAEFRTFADNPMFIACDAIEP